MEGLRLIGLKRGGGIFGEEEEASQDQLEKWKPTFYENVWEKPVSRLTMKLLQGIIKPLYVY